MLAREDAAWIAGFFEGEGSVCFRRNGSYAGLAIQIWQADREPLDRLAGLIGGNVKGPYRNNSGFARSGVLQPKFGWLITQPPDIETFYGIVKPWLSQRRIAQFDGALREFAAYRASLRYPLKGSRRTPLIHVGTT